MNRPGIALFVRTARAQGAEAHNSFKKGSLLTKFRLFESPCLFFAALKRYRALLRSVGKKAGASTFITCCHERRMSCSRSSCFGVSDLSDAEWTERRCPTAAGEIGRTVHR